ncbi:MAG TPA: hypothetical protein PKV41_01740, partial [Candidatus Omnitrophota bacterium]|nr:hypothetical protein [Candidatus Omnitrophota bacterium]
GQELNRLYEKQKSEITRLETAKIPPSIEENTLQERTANDMPEDLSGLGIELDEIVVSAGENVYPETEMLFGRPDSSPDRALEGRILSVDAETEFVIVSLGQTNGIKAGDVLAIYREGKYLGDIRVTRLQPEMSAADLIPPFSIRNVKKNDQVRIK